MSEFESWISEGIASTGIKGVIRLDAKDALAISDTAATKYALDGHQLRWWESLARPLLMVPGEKVTISELLSHLNGQCWFIPETGSRHRLVYSMRVEQVATLIEACPVDITYYALGEHLEWLITFSDHRVFYVCGSALETCLAKYGKRYD